MWMSLSEQHTERCLTLGVAEVRGTGVTLYLTRYSEEKGEML